MSIFKRFVKSFGIPNSIALLICIILLLLEFAGDRHGETKYEDFIFFPAFFGPKLGPGPVAETILADPDRHFFFWAQDEIF